MFFLVLFALKKFFFLLMCDNNHKWGHCLNPLIQSCFSISVSEVNGSKCVFCSLSVCGHFLLTKKEITKWFIFSVWSDLVKYLRNKYKGCWKIKETLDTSEREKHLHVIRMLMDRRQYVHKGQRGLCCFLLNENYKK